MKDSGVHVQAPPWNAKPTWYEVSIQDHMIHSDNERRMAQRINPRQVIELDASVKGSRPCDPARLFSAFMVERRRELTATMSAERAT
jgi:hypothetical protein